MFAAAMFPVVPHIIWGKLKFPLLVIFPSYICKGLNASTAITLIYMNKFTFQFQSDILYGKSRITISVECTTNSASVFSSVLSIHISSSTYLPIHNKQAGNSTNVIIGRQVCNWSAASVICIYNWTNESRLDNSVLLQKLWRAG